MNMNHMRLDVNHDEHLYPMPRKSPLTKQVNQVAYELPGSAYSNPWSYAPEFLKTFGDQKVAIGQSVVLDAVLLGTPRPRVCWLFNSSPLPFTDIELIDTADICQLKIRNLGAYHYGHYTLVAENEMGRATTDGVLMPFDGGY